MDSDILGRKRKALVDLSKLGGLIRGFARADDLDSLWDLHRQHPARPDLAEAIGRILARKSTDAAEPSLFECKGACFPQLTYADGSKFIELGTFEVDYDEPLDGMIKRAGITADPDEVSDTNPYGIPFYFPSKRGEEKIRLALINTGQEELHLEDYQEMAIRLDRREGDLCQLLAVVQRYPELLCDRDMFAPCDSINLSEYSSWRTYDPSEPALIPFALCLGGTPHEHSLCPLYETDRRDGLDWAIVAEVVE